MIKKIISSGQTSADQAALDSAIKLDMPHGGWIPKDRITEVGSLPDKYKLQEIPDDSYPRHTEQNVIDSDGTVIIAHGKLYDGSDYVREMAVKHGRVWIQIDLDITTPLDAALKISNWIIENSIAILNV
ncbi:MAG: putative molybdenum carrier protein, partial [Deltaproteobacteria bacterium]|nr:putative molybdenum carrier protein [Deltaproteobacteria bacterium]